MLGEMSEILNDNENDGKNNVREMGVVYDYVILVKYATNDHKRKKHRRGSRQQVVLMTDEFEYTKNK